MLKTFLLIFISSFLLNCAFSQNSLVGDGFGGRLWYKPTRFSVGSYAAYTICGDTNNPENNQLYGWGDNYYNELGLGESTSGVEYPTLIPEIDSVEFFSTGYVMGAIKYDHSGWLWGKDPISVGSFIINPSQIISDVFFCDASSSNVSFVKINGTVWSVGYNGSGQFGNGQIDNDFYSVPVQMLNVNNAARVANNWWSTSVLLRDSTVITTGGSYIGLGPDITQTTIPLPNPFLPKIVDIKSNARGTVALAANGDVYFWGQDNSVDYVAPIKIDSLSNIVAISGCDDGAHFLALDNNKNCYAWGDNGFQFGLNANPQATIQNPALVATDVIDIMAGETFSYIVKTDGSLWAVGSSTNGSIWLNLSNEIRFEFTQINPEIVPGWCTPFDPSDINFPNVFTPNGDQVNDQFYFENYEMEELNATIINRWGNVVATMNAPNDSWDGKTSNGLPCEEGTYFFVVNYKYHGYDWMTTQGHITLIK